MARMLLYTVVHGFLVSCASGSAFLPGTIASLYGEVASHSGFHVVLHAPEETTQDAKESLDNIMRVEDVKRVSEEQRFNEDKQDMVNTEKHKIRSLVHEALHEHRSH